MAADQIEVFFPVVIAVFTGYVFTCQDFPEVAGVIAGMDDPSDAPWRLEVSHCALQCAVRR